jgi:hypothetical protein
MLIEVVFPSEKEGKWKCESGTVEGGWLWVAFIGPEQCRDMEVVLWPATVSASIYQLWEWRGVERRGNIGVGRYQKVKRMRRAHLGSDVA